MEIKNGRIALTAYAKALGFDEDGINFLNDAILRRNAEWEAKEKAKQRSSKKSKKKA